MESLVQVESDANDDSVRRLRERLSIRRPNNHAGAMHTELAVVSRPSPAQPDIGQIERLRPQAAPPTPPPTSAGSIDMLSHQVRSCACKCDQSSCLKAFRCHSCNMCFLQEYGEGPSRDIGLHAVSPHILRRWNEASQRAYWQQRWRLWTQKPIAELQGKGSRAARYPGVQALLVVWRSVVCLLSTGLPRSTTITHICDAMPAVARFARGVQSRWSVAVWVSRRPL